MKKIRKQIEITKTLRKESQGSMKKINGEQGLILNKATGVSFGLIMLILSPMITAIIFCTILHNKVSFCLLQQDKMSAEVREIVRENATLKKKLSDDNIASSGELKKHISDYDLFSQKISYEIKDMNKKIENKTKDRWSKLDDMSFMHDFCEKNNLQMPSHKRVED